MNAVGYILIIWAACLVVFAVGCVIFYYIVEKMNGKQAFTMVVCIAALLLFIGLILIKMG